MKLTSTCTLPASSSRFNDTSSTMSSLQKQYCSIYTLQVLSGRGPSSVEAQLAQALLAMYSIDADKRVPMRDVVAYVSGVLALNGAASATEECLPRAIEKHLPTFATAAQSVLSSLLAGSASNKNSTSSNNGSGVTDPRDDGNGVAAPVVSELFPSAGQQGALLPMGLSKEAAMCAVQPILDEAIQAVVYCCLEDALPVVRGELHANATSAIKV